MADPTLIRLDNGMRVAVESLERSRSVSICLLVPGGSAHDPEERQGRSALFAETLLRGAGDMDARALACALDAAGASRHVDVETFHMRLSAATTVDRFAQLAPLLATIVLEPRFAEQDFEPARQLCLAELEGLKDDPHERVLTLLREKHHPSPRNRSGLGTRQGLEALTRSEVVKGWEEVARPEGAIVGVAGAVERDAAVEAFARAFESWRGAPPPLARGETPVRGLHALVEPTHQTHIAVAHDAAAEPDPASALDRLAAAVLSGGMAGRLFTTLRERRSLCYAVSAAYGADRDFGQIAAYVGSTPDKAQEALEALVEELVRIRSVAGAVTQEEFERAKVGLRSRFVLSGESTGARAAALARDVRVLGRPRSLQEALAPLERASLEDLNEHLERGVAGALTAVAIGPAPLRPPAPLSLTSVVEAEATT